MYFQCYVFLCNSSRPYFFTAKITDVDIRFFENGWILADFYTPDRYFSFLMKFKNSSV